MTVRKIAMPIALRRNNNQHSNAYGKYYAEVYAPKTLSLKGMLNRVAMQQSVYSPDIVNGVLDKLTTAMVELLKQGQPVKWNGFGTFIPYIESAYGGVRKDDLLAGRANPNTAIKGVRINFIPENTQGEELTSRKFKEMVTFEYAGFWDLKTITVDGHKKNVYTLVKPKNYTGKVD